MSKEPVLAIVDVTSPLIRYSGPWVSQSTGGGEVRVVFNPESSLTFDFVGSRLWAFSAVYPLNRTTWAVSFAIDDQLIPSDRIGPNATETKLDAVYDSGELQPKQHNFTLRVVNASLDSPFIFGALAYLPVTVNPTLTESGVKYTATSAPHVTVYPSPKSSKPSTALIAGLSVLGALVVAFIAIGIFFFCRRRKKNSGPYDRPDLFKEDPSVNVHPFESAVPFIAGAGSENHSSTITAYPLPTPGTVTYVPSHATASVASPSEVGTLYSTTPGDPNALGYSVVPYRPDATPSAPPTIISSSSGSANTPGGSSQALLPPPSLNPTPPPNSKAALIAANRQAQAQATFHADSGIRFNQPANSEEPDDAESPPLDVPPGYTPN